MDMSATLVSDVRTGIILQDIDVCMMINERNPHNTVGVRAEGGDVKRSELGTSRERVAPVDVVEMKLLSNAGTINKPELGIVPPTVLLDGSPNRLLRVPNVVASRKNRKINILMRKAIVHVHSGMHITGYLGRNRLENHESARQNRIIRRVVIDKQNIIA